MGEVDQSASDLRELERFIVNNLDLERLEALLDRFNIFEATGFPIRREVRHSDFLAFLMRPREDHGMGDAFVKRLLQQALVQSSGASEPVTPTELSSWDLGQMQVRREWRYIDIFLLDESNQLTVIIENKIDAGEGRGQLNRYYQAVREEYS
ncbi:MAG: PD-(D/E)XK nuclease family protein, partial [Rubrobacter sp.]|nr:PD-(D/E)XK nuclease family protein [Rubrobacter sp.]